jgi:hypothetical protein
MDFLPYSISPPFRTASASFTTNPHTPTNHTKNPLSNPFGQDYLDILSFHSITFRPATTPTWPQGTERYPGGEDMGHRPLQELMSHHPSYHFRRWGIKVSPLVFLSSKWPMTFQNPHRKTRYIYIYVRNLF